MLIGEAERLGYKKVMIIPGGSIVPKALMRLKPRVCLAAGCLKELVMGSFICEKFGIIGQGLPLLRDGCLETDLDWNLLRNFLHKHMNIVTA